MTGTRNLYARVVRRTAKAARGLRRRFRAGGVILVYHRVAELDPDSNHLAVSPQRFAEQLEHLQRSWTPMRLMELVDAVERRSVPPRAVVITLDDGYVDNYTQAAPLLEAYEIPATVFVTSGHVGTAQEFWWDEVEVLLLAPEQPPDCLRVTAAGQAHEWPTDSPVCRQMAYAGLRDLLRNLDADERERLMDQVAAWAGTRRQTRPHFRAMTASEVMDLAQSEFIDIGAHTVTHPRLSALPPDRQYTEVANSRGALESLIGRPVATFAYPYGQPQDLTADTVGIVRKAGFRAACTTIPGSVESGDDLFRLRRGPVFDWDLEVFARQLNRYYIDRG